MDCSRIKGNVLLKNNKNGLNNQVVVKQKSELKEFKKIYNLNQEKFLFSKNITERRQIASLTKIMTLLVVLKQIDCQIQYPEKIYFKVSKYAASMVGTSAQLQQGDSLSLWDLLHGLMLPSGNDAAVCLAENIGDLIKNDLNKNPITVFVDKMNLYAKQLGMKNTKYNNPHGLSDKANLSTLQDQLILCKALLRETIATKIIGRKLYFGSITDIDGWTKQIFWQNTNRLLYKGYKGIKTGVTKTAGACLASWYNENEMNLICIVLNCQNTQYRWKDTEKLINESKLT